MGSHTSGTWAVFGWPCPCRNLYISRWFTTKIHSPAPQNTNAAQSQYPKQAPCVNMRRYGWMSTGTALGQTGQTRALLASLGPAAPPPPRPRHIANSALLVAVMRQPEAEEHGNMVRGDKV